MTAAVTAFVCTIPAGTAFPATASVALAVPGDTVTSVRWRVPPGPRGHLSWFLAQSGVQVLPGRAGTAVVADDETFVWDTLNLPDSGAWTLVGSNSGSYDHSVYLEFATEAGQAVLVSDPEGPVPPGWPLADADIPTMWGAGGGVAV